MIKSSTGLAAYLMVTGSAKDAFDGGLVKVYSGAAPATADTAVSGTLLWTVSVDGDGTGVTFSSSASGRSMVKEPTETWQGAIAATGTAGYWRLVATGDDGTLSTTAPRIQGTCGDTADADMYMTNPSLVENSDLDAKVLAAFSVALPTY